MSIVASGQALNVGNPRKYPYLSYLQNNCIVRPSYLFGFLGGPNTFQIQVDDSVDVTQMNISIHGPSAPEIWTNNRGEGLLEVSYRIGLVGRYLLTITYKGTSISGSPYTLIVR